MILLEAVAWPNPTPLTPYAILIMSNDRQYPAGRGPSYASPWQPGQAGAQDPTSPFLFSR